MSNDKSRGIVGVFILVSVLFLVFIGFAFYTVSNLKSTSQLTSSGFGNSKKSEIAVVEIEGVIMQSKKAIKKLLIAEKDKKIKAIIIRIDSPGGAVGPTQEIYEEIIRIDKIKPVYASFGSVAASGGYYIGAACRKIFSPKGSLTGSIGVIMNFMDLSRLYRWAMVSPEVVKAGKYKDIGSPARQMTILERGILTDMIDNVHNQFIDDIWAIRKKKIVGGLKGLREYAQGQIFSGEGAKKLGLVDENLGLWAAARTIHKELKLESEFGLKYIKLKKDFSLSDIIGGIQQSVEDIKFSVKGSLVPMLLFRP